LGKVDDDVDDFQLRKGLATGCDLIVAVFTGIAFFVAEGGELAGARREDGGRRGRRATAVSGRDGWGDSR